MTSLVRLGQSSLHRSIHSFRVALPRCASTRAIRQFIPSQLYNVENVEEYRPGGYHPIVIGDLFADGRYRVIHKFGFGGSSTIWLARDQQKEPGRLVTLKAMRADVSPRPPYETPELVVSKWLQVTFHFGGAFRTVEDHFIVRGPNGSHLFLISPLAGPSVLAISEVLTMLNGPGRVSGSGRLRGDLARKVAKETAMAIYRMHFADLSTSNILFRVPETVRRWSDDEVYSYLGPPKAEKVKTYGREPHGIHAPPELIAPIESLKFLHESPLQESVMIIDYGQSYTIASPPTDYCTKSNYVAPEMGFEGRIGLEADIWALGCAIFEIRAGRPLFDPLFGSDVDILMQTVQILGRLPDPWWSTFEDWALWFESFEGYGEPRSVGARERGGLVKEASKSSIGKELRSIGRHDVPSFYDEGPMVEKSGVGLDKEEVKLLDDLLRKMLRYRPEERIGMQEVIEHPWFEL